MTNDEIVIKCNIIMKCNHEGREQYERIGLRAGVQQQFHVKNVQKVTFTGLLRPFMHTDIRQQELTDVRQDGSSLPDWLALR